jgi:glycosyltransferase involved in cell wall biosynthesis
VNVFLWHVHGSYTTALVHGGHDYLLPVEPDRGPYGRGRAQTWEWPQRAREVTRAQAADTGVDVVVLQRPEELELVPAWLGGRRPGVDVPVVYLEHNTPGGSAATARHPVADRPDVSLLVHVTHTNALFWDNGSARVRVIEHGIVDPGYRYDGALPHAAVVVNEPARRGRAVGADLFDRFRAAAPLDLFGMGTEPLGGRDLPQAELHGELARRRVYVHTHRWTSLGLSLLEAMHLGIPAVALAATEVPRAVPEGCGFVSNDVEELVEAVRLLIADPERARAVGRLGRREVRRRYSLERFLDDWDRVLKEVAA